MQNYNKNLLEKISHFKSIISSAREEKLKIDLEINKVQKSFKEFEEKKELRRRELINQLLPVTNSPRIARESREIQTAPERTGGGRPPLRSSRNVRSAKTNYTVKQAIKDSLHALPGISENLNSPSLIEAFRQSYIRDLNDYLRMTGGKGGKEMPVGVESLGVGALDAENDSSGMKNQKLFPGANFSFKKINQHKGSLRSLKSVGRPPSSRRSGLMRSPGSGTGPVEDGVEVSDSTDSRLNRGVMGVDGVDRELVFQESEVIKAKNFKKSLKSEKDEIDFEGDFESKSRLSGERGVLKGSKQSLRSKKRPDIKFKKSVNQLSNLDDSSALEFNQSHSRGDSGAQPIEYPRSGDFEDEIIEEIEEVEDLEDSEKNTEFGNSDDSRVSEQFKSDSSMLEEYRDPSEPPQMGSVVKNSSLEPSGRIDPFFKEYDKKMERKRARESRELANNSPGGNGHQESVFMRKKGPNTPSSEVPTFRGAVETLKFNSALDEPERLVEPEDGALGSLGAPKTRQFRAEEMMIEEDSNESKDISSSIHDRERPSEQPGYHQKGSNRARTPKNDQIFSQPKHQNYAQKENKLGSFLKQSSEHYIPIVKWEDSGKKHENDQNLKNEENRLFEQDNSLDDHDDKEMDDSQLSRGGNPMQKKKRSFRINMTSSHGTRGTNENVRPTEQDFIDFQNNGGLERKTEALAPNIVQHGRQKSEILKNFDFGESDINFVKKNSQDEAVVSGGSEYLNKASIDQGIEDGVPESRNSSNLSMSKRRQQNPSQGTQSSFRVSKGSKRSLRSRNGSRGSQKTPKTGQNPFNSEKQFNDLKSLKSSSGTHQSIMNHTNKPRRPPSSHRYKSKEYKTMKDFSKGRGPKKEFNKRNQRIIDRFDAFFRKFDIKEEDKGEKSARRVQSGLEDPRRTSGLTKASKEGMLPPKSRNSRATGQSGVSGVSGSRISTEQSQQSSKGSFMDSGAHSKTLNRSRQRRSSYKIRSRKSVTRSSRGTSRGSRGPHPHPESSIQASNDSTTTTPHIMNQKKKRRRPSIKRASSRSKRKSYSNYFTESDLSSNPSKPNTLEDSEAFDSQRQDTSGQDLQSESDVDTYVENLRPETREQRSNEKFKKKVREEVVEEFLRSGREDYGSEDYDKLGLGLEEVQQLDSKLSTRRLQTGERSGLLAPGAGNQHHLSSFGGLSENVDDEVIELSQGTKDIKSLFKNKLHLNKTSKSNRYQPNDDY